MVWSKLICQLWRCYVLQGIQQHSKIVSSNNRKKSNLRLRSHDGYCYRARVREVQFEVPYKALVQFIDFGNCELVETVYHYPTWLGLEMAPAAMEVELAVSLVSSTREEMEQVLMGEEGEKILEVQMEKEKVSGLHVARFFENGLEVSFCSKVEEALSNVV